MSRFQLLNIEGVKLSQARGLVSSVALHVAAIAIIANLSVGIRERLPLTEQAAAPAPIYIDMKALKDLKILRALPVIRALRSGGTPDSRSRSPREVLQASTVQHPKLTIIVTPLKPDNKRQAIHQQVAPPDLKIQAEQSIPDIVLVDGTAPARPQVDMSIHRPTAPEIARSPGGLSAPVVPSNAPALPMRIDSSVQQPRMPVSYFANNSLQTPRGELPPNRQEASAPPGSSADASGEILALSVDPATFSKFAALVQGNRYATLAIAPAKEGAGSPGGSPNGVSAAGLGGTGKGGDASGAVGPGHTGGSWTDEVRTATLSASGGTGKLGGVDANRILSPVLPSTIYPVAIDPKIRRVPMIISSGPMGGGGLDVYGALPCGKVYSIFLPMPGKNWVLQYCAPPAQLTAASKPALPTSGVVRLEAGLIPPSAEQQFDFRRVPVPEKDADKMIVLRGSLGKDGAIRDVQVYRGVLAEMDEEAAIAFRHWKFKPAARGGEAVDVELLVGIPSRLSEKPNQASSGESKSHE